MKGERDGSSGMIDTSSAATTATRPPAGRRCGTSGSPTASPMSSSRPPTPTTSSRPSGTRPDGHADRHRAPAATAGRQPRPRRWHAARRLAASTRSASTPAAKTASVGPGKGGSALSARARGAGPVLPRRPLQRRRASAATCCRAATAGTAVCSVRRARASRRRRRDRRRRARPRDADHHADLYWSARGAGPGFFGVVTALPPPVYTAPGGLRLEPVRVPHRAGRRGLHLGRAIGAEVDRRVEMQILMSRAASSRSASTTRRSSSRRRCSPTPRPRPRQALALLETCPVARPRARSRSRTRRPSCPTGTTP